MRNQVKRGMLALAGLLAAAGGLLSIQAASAAAPSTKLPPTIVHCTLTEDGQLHCYY